MTDRTDRVMWFFLLAAALGLAAFIGCGIGDAFRGHEDKPHRVFEAHPEVFNGVACEETP
jgi:hypothetical protein